MTSDLFLSDLFLWGLQVTALAALAALFAVVARLRRPDARLFYWQTVLLACFALPFIRPLQRPVAVATPIVSKTSAMIADASYVHQSAVFPLTEIIIGVLFLGVVIRLGLIAAGLIRLRSYRRNSRPLELSSASAWNVEADLRVSDDVTGPVTFGVRRPVVLLPAGFATMDDASRDAVLCHEILHVRRKDWLFTVAEEIVRALFWFHPAIWWALGEIQLAREQTVDRGVVATTKARDQYVDALLAMAGVSEAMDLPPAPLFLRKRHLRQRVVSILKEVQMSRKRTLSTLAAGVALMGACCWFITGALPLRGAPQTVSGAPQFVANAPGVSVETGGEQLMHRSSVAYPREAIATRTEGTVVAQVRTDVSGNVLDATILSGPDKLHKSVLQSVLGWHFGKSASPAVRQVVVTFTLPKDQTAAATNGPTSPPVKPIAIARLAPFPAADDRSSLIPPSFLISRIQVAYLSHEASAELLRSLPVHENDTVTLDQLSAVNSAVQAFDEHLIVRTSVSPSQQGVTLTIMPADSALASAPPPPPPPSEALGTPAPPGQIRVGGQIQSANLISQTPPVYPPLAKAARVQGTVQFEATIGKDGSVENLKLISGPPLLVNAA